MMEQSDPNNAQEQPVEMPRPDDVGTIYLDGCLRIFDPNTDEIFLETRT